MHEGRQDRIQRSMPQAMQQLLEHYFAPPTRAYIRGRTIGGRIAWVIAYATTSRSGGGFAVVNFLNTCNFKLHGALRTPPEMQNGGEYQDEKISCGPRHTPNALAAPAMGPTAPKYQLWRGTRLSGT